jgi:S-adenosylmethionine:tRNA ribosyltransferase-isomerase
MKDNISIEEFYYDLPDDKIANFPLSKRDESKLLVYKDQIIKETTFKYIDEFLDADTLLIFNQTKVIPARLFFYTDTNAKIEIFCLEKISENQNLALWQCFIGNAAKWKADLLEISIYTNTLSAKIIERLNDSYIIEFKWNDSSSSFSEMLSIFGQTPLPPYIKREAISADKETYQTVFSKYEGSVAAPTAGLHFTDIVLDKLYNTGIKSAPVTLHVGAGTFKPIKTENVLDHEMHHEWLTIERNDLQTIVESKNRKIIPIGTTSLRTMETLYWLGCKAFSNQLKTDEIIEFSQWEYKQISSSIDKQVAFESLYSFMQTSNLDRLVAKTKIMITPEYEIKTASAIITNFHQPSSTLLLLISAFIGKEWKSVYNYALENNFRFLSYGDSCLLHKSR